MKSGTPEYWDLHRRIRRMFVHGETCELCHSSEKKLEWANRDHQYSEAREDWMSVCHPCHSHHDEPDICKKGHELVGANLIARKDGRRGCRECRNATWRRGYKAGRYTGGMNGRARKCAV